MQFRRPEPDLIDRLIDKLKQGSLRDMSLVHNERIKLTAAAIDRLATAMFVVGFLGPLSATVFGSSSTNIAFHSILDYVEGAFWLAVGVALHMIARHVLNGLKS
jgi:hypothetical protein